MSFHTSHVLYMRQAQVGSIASYIFDPHDRYHYAVLFSLNFYSEIISPWAWSIWSCLSMAGLQYIKNKLRCKSDALQGWFSFVNLNQKKLRVPSLHTYATKRSSRETICFQTRPAVLFADIFVGHRTTYVPLEETLLFQMACKERHEQMPKGRHVDLGEKNHVFLFKQAGNSDVKCKWQQ